MRLPLRTILLALIFITGLVFTFAIPPFQKPDEQTHFMRALILSRGTFICTAGPRTRTTIDKQYLDMIARIQTYALPLHADHHIRFNDYRRMLLTPSRPHQTSISAAMYCNYPILPYLPQVLGLTLGGAAHLNPYQAFMLGRLATFLVAFGWLIYLLRRASRPIGNIFLFLATIPMVIHQLSAYTYDGIELMIALTIIVVVTEYMTKRHVTLKEIAILWGLTMAMLLSRSGGHELVPLIVFLIPPATVARTRRGYITIIGCYFGALVAGYALVKLHDYGAYVGAGLPAHVDPHRQLLSIAAHPVDYGFMLIKTTYARIGFYTQSMIGILGWLEYGIPHWTYAVYGAGALWVVGINEAKPRLSARQLAILTVILGASYIMIISIFYLVWTPVGARIADGIQGRYFLVFLPLLILLATQFRHRYIPRWPAITIPPILSLIVMIGTAAAVIQSVVTRYLLFR